MALSPLAALSLPLVNNENWSKAASEFGASVRQRIQETLSAEGFKQWARDVDENLTFMDWSAGKTGIDLRYIWDPELWVKFKEAVWADEPQIFFNKFAERIEYRECKGTLSCSLCTAGTATPRHRTIRPHEAVCTSVCFSV